jgi:predicted 3-demethylubiquinone-9 3-methyltransferase (glyoxalase superfamily)
MRASLAGRCRFLAAPFDYKTDRTRGSDAGRYPAPMCGQKREESAMTQPIAPCLWFDNNAEEAVDFYVSVFKDSRVLHVDRFTTEGPDPDAPVMFIEFQINGQPFQAINGGPQFTFTEAISFSIECADQAEVDYYWNALTDGGEPGECGWLKDKFGVSWQVVPRVLTDLLRDADRERAGQVMRRMLQMTKLDVAELQAAYEA